MRWKFSIHNEDSDVVYAVLEYDWDKDEYCMHINKNAHNEYPPAIIGIQSRRGNYELDDKLCRLFIRDRVIPANRQNIGQILRDMGEPYYHECIMLKHMPTSTLDFACVDFIGEFE